VEEERREGLTRARGCSTRLSSSWGAGRTGNVSCKVGQSLQSLLGRLLSLFSMELIIRHEGHQHDQKLTVEHHDPRSPTVWVHASVPSSTARHARMTAPAEPARLTDSGQADTRKRTARANSGNASRWIHNRTADEIRNCPKCARMAGWQETWSPRQRVCIWRSGRGNTSGTSSHQPRHHTHTSSAPRSDCATRTSRFFILSMKKEAGTCPSSTVESSNRARTSTQSSRRHHNNLKCRPLDHHRAQRKRIGGSG
jgi:hypothetical protein